MSLCCQQGVIWFRLEEGPLHFVAGQYFKCAPAPTMLPLSTHRYPWPPAGKLSGAAAHAVNLPSQAGAHGGRRALTSLFCRGRAAAFACGKGFRGDEGRGEGARSTLPPRRDVGKGVLRYRPLPLFGRRSWRTVVSWFGGRFIVCRALACHDCFYYHFESSMTQLV